MYTCLPSHRLKRSGHSCPRWVNAGNKNTPSMHNPQRWNVNTSMAGLKMVTYAKISPKGIAGELEGEEENHCSACVWPKMGGQNRWNNVGEICTLKFTTHHLSFSLPPPSVSFPPHSSHFPCCLAGLVVKASILRAEYSGFEPHLWQDFSGSSHTSDFKIGTPVATHYKVSIGTGRPSVNFL